MMDTRSSPFDARRRAHNNSEVVARFFGIAKPILDGDVVLLKGTEVSAKGVSKGTAESAVKP
jgi:hypothetical protein